jgi:hypothetical protein
VAHPRIIKQPIPTSPIARKLIKEHTTTVS